MAPRPIPVLVVGAGPTGLTMAIELARRGLVVRLIEQLAEPPSTSRALVVQPRTLELFDDMSVIDAALAAGRPVDQFTQVLRGRRLVQLDFRAQLASAPKLHTTYPRPLMLPQDQTEQILTDHLSGLGVVIERGVTYEGLVQREDAVQVVLRHQDGRQERVAARWLIGADGAHSRVRQAAGIPFPGATYAEEFIQADARLDWELPDGQLYIFPGPDGLLAVWTMPGPHRFRIFGNTSPSPRSDAAAEPSLAEIQALLDARLPLPARIVTTTWTARYRLHRRGVSRYRQGRVFLAGDAAHPQPGRSPGHEHRHPGRLQPGLETRRGRAWPRRSYPARLLPPRTTSGGAGPAAHHRPGLQPRCIPRCPPPFPSGLSDAAPSPPCVDHPGYPAAGGGVDFPTVHRLPGQPPQRRVRSRLGATGRGLGIEPARAK